MFNTLRPFLSRIIASGIAGLVAFLSAKLGITLGAEEQASLVSVGVTIALVAYSFVHKLIDKKVNPTDAAAKDVAEIGATGTLKVR